MPYRKTKEHANGETKFIRKKRERRCNLKKEDQEALVAALRGMMGQPRLGRSLAEGRKSRKKGNLAGKSEPTKLQGPQSKAGNRVGSTPGKDVTGRSPRRARTSEGAYRSP